MCLGGTFIPGKRISVTSPPKTYLLCRRIPGPPISSNDAGDEASESLGETHITCESVTLHCYRDCRSNGSQEDV